MNLNFNFQSIILVALITLCHLVFSQDLPLPTNIQSPNAASLGKYGDIPVSYYTGTPNVTIPLYSINDFGIPLDVYLSYDASGVRVNGMPGWVGQNWSLQSGGVITRLIKTVPDEQHKPTSSYWWGEYYGYFNQDSHSQLSGSNWNSESHLSTLYQERLPTSNGESQEFEPDIFTFNFMGHTGKFFMGEDGDFRVSSSSNLKIIISEDDLGYPFDEETYPVNDNTGVYADQKPATKMIYKITIVDDQGNMFIFGNTDESVEYSVDFFQQIEIEWRANSWFLTEVKNRFGKTIYEFEYERDDFIAAFYPYAKSDNVEFEFDESFLGFDLDCLTSYYTSLSYGGNLISPVYLKTIKTINGDIDFNRQNTNALSYKDDSTFISYLSNTYVTPSNPYLIYHLLPYNSASDMLDKLEWKKLTSISGLSKSIDLSYNDLPYYTPNDRLALLNLSIDNTQEYDFEYNDISGLPKFLSTEIDHYGYYDGTPWDLNSFSNHYSSRVPNSTYAKKGILTKIIYPTEGWTEFNWESNTYSGYMSDDKSSLIGVSNTLTGGLRIKEILNNDGKGNEIIKEYKYLKDYDPNTSSIISSGIIENKPKYWFNDFRIQSYQYDTGQFLMFKSVFSTNPILPMTTNMGTHIGYSEVVEIYPNNGYNIYKYTSNRDSEYRDEYDFFALNPDPSPYTNYSDKSLLRGKVKSVEVFNEENDLVKSTINHYEFDNTKFVKGVYVEGITCGTNVGNGFLVGSPYKLFYFDNNIFRKEEIAYENGEELKQETEYDWAYYPNTNMTNGNQFLQSMKTQTYSILGDSDLEYRQELYKYNFEESSAINNSLVDDNYFSIVQTDFYKNTSKIGSKRIVFDYFGNDNSILPKEILSAKGNGGFEESNSIDEYNLDSKAVEKFHIIGGAYTQLKYYRRLIDNLYRTTPQIMFRIEGPELVNTSYLNSKVAEINSQSISHDQILSLMQQVRTYYSDHMVTSYTYFSSSQKIRTITDPLGNTQYYSYDSNDRLRLIKDKQGKTLKQFIYNYAND